MIFVSFFCVGGFVKITETGLGFVLESENFVALLGGQEANVTTIKASFPEFDFVRVKQTHGDLIVHSADSSLDYQVEADAHFTDTPKLGVLISTADCIPILIYSPDLKVVASIHAGWRGVANRIVPKTVQHLVLQGAD
ncbi:MAG: hypothetical protein EOP06_16310, partial [Proteobacteria bacterium]